MSAGHVCDDHGCDIPSTVRASFSAFGGTYRATCSECPYVCAYWECACEWDHDCDEWRAVPANLGGYLASWGAL